MKLTSTNRSLHFLNILVYGESGVGKTYLCSTAPNPLIISAEAGLLSLADFNIDVFEITKRKDCDEIYDFLTMSKEAKKYETICIDSLSEIAEVLLTDEKKRNKDARAAYGVMNDEMQIVVRGFRDLPYHVYFTAKNKKQEDESVGTIYHMPSLPGKQMLENLPYFFDLVCKLDFGKLADGTRYRYLSTVGDRNHVAKDRSGKLHPAEKPDLTYLINKIVSKSASNEPEPEKEEPITDEHVTKESTEPKKVAVWKP